MVLNDGLSVSYIQIKSLIDRLCMKREKIQCVIKSKGKVMTDKINIDLRVVGYVDHQHQNVPRHWSVSDLEGRIILQDEFTEGIRDISPGDEIAVIFLFHKSPEFNADYILQNPPHLGKEKGVFSTCSPRRPNPVGLSVLEITAIGRNYLEVRGIDMLNGTPVIDIKPHVRK